MVWGAFPSDPRPLRWFCLRGARLIRAPACPQPTSIRSGCRSSRRERFSAQERRGAGGGRAWFPTRAGRAVAGAAGDRASRSTGRAGRTAGAFAEHDHVQELGGEERQWEWERKPGLPTWPSRAARTASSSCWSEGPAHPARELGPGIAFTAPFNQAAKRTVSHARPGFSPAPEPIDDVGSTSGRPPGGEFRNNGRMHVPPADTRRGQRARRGPHGPQRSTTALNKDRRVPKRRLGPNIPRLIGP